MATIPACSANSDKVNAVAADDSKLSPEECAENAYLVHASSNDRVYHIEPGDKLDVDSYLNPEFSQEVTVRPDGMITMRLVGAVRAGGLTPQDLATALNVAYSKELRRPDMTVSVAKMPSREVYVQGQVNKPGGFPLEPGMTALQAIADAGGLTDKAGDKAVLIRRDACGIPGGSPIDLSKATDNPATGEDLALESRDIIVVPRSRIANVDEFVEQYIRDILPVQPYISPTF